jgi:hypothetical protein
MDNVDPGATTPRIAPPDRLNFLHKTDKEFLEQFEGDARKSQAVQLQATLHQLSQMAPKNESLKRRLSLINSFIGPRHNYVDIHPGGKIHVLSSGQKFPEPDSRNYHNEVERISQEQRAHAAGHGRRLFGELYDELMGASGPQSPRRGEWV